MLKIKTKKAQISLEVIVVVMFIMVFLFIFTQLANTTQATIETNHIRVQQNQLAYSLNDFFQTVKDVASDEEEFIDTNITDFRFEYDIPNIVIGGQIVPCVIDVTSNQIEITVDYLRERKKLLSELDLRNISGTYNCGQTIVCVKSGNGVSCS
jgi:predicted PurR-regulated permease PerM